MSAMERAFQDTLSGTLNNTSVNSFGSTLGDTTYNNCTFNLDTPASACNQVVVDTLSSPEFIESDRSFGASIGYGLASLTVGVLTSGVSLIGQILWVSSKAIGSSLDNGARGDYIEYKKEKEVVEVEEIRPLSKWEKDQLEYKKQRLELLEFDSKMAKQQMELEIQRQVWSKKEEPKKIEMESDIIDVKPIAKVEIKSDVINLEPIYVSKSKQGQAW